MRCVRCLDAHLVAEEFQGQIIDVCPRCHGVWLPRHEFDALIARRVGAGPSPRDDRRFDRRDERYDRRDARYDQDHRSHDSSARLPVQGRRKSWLMELFD